MSITANNGAFSDIMQHFSKKLTLQVVINLIHVKTARKLLGMKESKLQGLVGSTLFIRKMGGERERERK